MMWKPRTELVGWLGVSWVGRLHENNLGFSGPITFLGVKHLWGCREAGMQVGTQSSTRFQNHLSVGPFTTWANS